ncbi:MAG TPA: protein kinase [Solirubrobacteraceae bacterium]|jgi:serine/threonine-protein kinase
MPDTRRRLAGRYELGAIVGRGGMGTVHRARDLVLDRTVAVKLLPAEIAEQDSSVGARFEREARAAASLSHDGVVAVYDTGEDDATRFIVMEFVDGRSLADVLREDAPLGGEQASAIVSRVAAALGAAHAAGIVHRDVKPANVMLADDGTVKVLDFGIARSLDGSTLTLDASVLGTAGYMAPEQALGGRADERSDVYSLGCLLYALLTGAPPFTGESAAAVLHQHVNSDPRAPRALNRSISPSLEALVLSMLAKSPDARPQDAAEVHRLLDASASPPPARPILPPRPTEPTRRLQAAPGTPAPGFGRSRSGRGRAAAGAALAAAALLTAGTVALTAGGGSGHRAGASPPRAALAGATAARTTAARSRPQAAATSPKTPPPTRSTPAAAASPPQASGAAAAAVLSSLLARMAAAGAIDPQAARALEGALGHIVRASEAGHPIDAQRRLLELSGRLAALQEQGGLSPAAAGSLGSALAGLGTALGATPQGSTGTDGPSEAAATPPAGDAGPRGRGHGHHGGGGGD